MSQKRVRLGSGWRVAQNEIGLLIPVPSGYIVKPGDICERGGEYFRLSKRGLKRINSSKGRVLTGNRPNPSRYGVPPQPKRELNDSQSIKSRGRALNLIVNQCKIHPSLKVKNGNIEVISAGGNFYYVHLATAQVRDANKNLVCVVCSVSPRYEMSLPIEDIALAKALTIANRPDLIYTVQ
ncbi:MAG: hypothetical protein ACFFC7_25805 [Candidatus Hermodarchaeota archaeon]